MTEVIEVAQTYLGNVNSNSVLANLINTKLCLKLSLSASEQPKGRIHGYTTSGISVGIIKERDRSLASGDLYQTDSGKLLLIELEELELLVIELATTNNLSSAQLVQLGHVLGNHHYPISIDGDRILVQLVRDKAIVEKLIKDRKISGLKVSYQKKSPNSNFTFYQHSH